MPKYKLRRSFYDGLSLYRAGAVVEIEEGKAPPSAQLLDKPEPEPEPAADPEASKEPELDLNPKPGTALSDLVKKK